jgi:hypothetical protein
MEPVNCLLSDPPRNKEEPLFASIMEKALSWILPCWNIVLMKVSCLMWEVAG